MKTSGACRWTKASVVARGEKDVRESLAVLVLKIASDDQTYGVYLGANSCSAGLKGRSDKGQSGGTSHSTIPATAQISIYVRRSRDRA